METVQLEVTTNYLSYLAMTKELIPFFRGKTSETALVYISSGLAMVPSPARSNYCATKAALHQWVLSLRVSLKATKIRVIEIFPPAVQTELHDEKHQPDIKNGSQMGMPLAEFTDEVRSLTRPRLPCSSASRHGKAWSMVRSRYRSAQQYMLSTPSS